MGNVVPCLPEREASVPTHGQRIVRMRDGERFRITSIGHVVEVGNVFYDFMVAPPESMGAPGQVIRKTFADFQELDTIICQRYRDEAPHLPQATFFEYTDNDFISDRIVGLTSYLISVLELEPLPQLRALREFLGIWQPLPIAPTLISNGNPMIAGAWRLPVGVVSAIIGHHEPVWVLRTCSPVCHAMLSATRNARCWPSLRFCTHRGERWIDPLFTILTCVGMSLQSLTLDVTFENTKLGIAVPTGLLFNSLRRLSLSIWDVETVNLMIEILESIESPSLQKISLEGSILSPTLLHALCRVVLLTSGNLVGLKLLWFPHHGQIRLDQGVALALGTIVAAIPRAEELTLGVPDRIRSTGNSRCLMPLFPPHVAIPNTQPLLSDTAGLVGLRYLCFDFLSDDALVCFNTLEDRSLHLQRARFSGSKQQLQEPNEALVSLLAKLGDELEEFALIIDIEKEIRPFFRGFLRTRVGALPNQWQDRSSLRSLELSWTAFDDDGIRCITENCPQLHSLLLTRSEYWTDDAVAAIAQNLPLMQHFRLRSSAMLSDRALYCLGEVAHKFVTLELEPSYSMSGYGLDHLRQKLDPNAAMNAGGLLDFLDPSAGAVRMMAAAAGETDLFAPPAAHNNVNPRVRRSSANSLQLLKPEEDEWDEETSILSQFSQHRRPLQIGW